MAGLPEIRAIVDWNDDGFFEPVNGQSLPNLIPTALSLIDVDVTQTGSGASFTHQAEVSDYGVRYQRNVMGTSVFGGMIVGKSSGGSVNTIPINASTTYRATAWVRGVSGSYGSVPVVLQTKDQGDNILGTSSNVTLTSSWQKVSFSFSTGVGDTFLSIWMLKNNSATNITIDITGWMLTAGSTTVDYYNAGDTYSAYEDISEDVVMAQWDSAVNRQTRIPDEGQLTLSLDNTARKYSPRYASSPLFGAFQYGLRVRIDIKRPSTGAWVTVWAGWISGYDPHPMPTRGDNLAVITATQGQFNLDSVPLQTSIMENVTFDAVLPEILHSGWYPPITPHVFVLGKSQLGVDTWLPQQSDLVFTLETGKTVFPLVGDGWSDKDTRATQVLKDLMEVEQGLIFFGSSGRLNFKNRESFRWDTASVASLNLDTQSTNSTYKYAPQEINAVNLTYYPPADQDNQIIWESRGTRLARSKSRRRVQAIFEYEEGAKKTVKSINPFGVGGTDSTLSAVDASGNVYDSRYYYGVAELHNGKGRLTIYNQGPTDAYFSILLKGTVEISADSEQVQVSAENNTRILKDADIDNRLLKDEDTATDLGNYILTTRGNDYDEFTSIEIQAKDNDAVNRQLDIAVGNVIDLTETQTAVTAKKHIVIGRHYSWTPGHLIVSFDLMRVDETAFWIMGTSELSHETVLGY